MNKKFLQKIKTTLLDEKSELLARVYGEDIDTQGDETDEIQAKMIFNITKSLSVRDKQKTALIEKALVKLKDGNYGKCEECEEDIEEKRLEFNPHFALCIGCAEEAEDNAKRRKG